jgi:hypothetical protein
MKKINFKKVFTGRNTVISLFILAAIFLFGHTALAGFGEWAGNVVGGIIGIFIRAIGAILILLVGVLMDVAAYSDFIHAPAVTNGWIVARDVCNMFFVVILLIIAFATILNQEEYGAKKMLPKLVIAAVLINFSKMFCGLMIDVASVVMLTFVNAFSAIGAGNMLSMLGIDKITQIDTTSGSVTFAMIVSSYIFGLIYVIIATVVVASMLGMLVMRIVMIWILVVLSPFAFFLEAVPGGGQGYAKEWWSRWSSNLIVGPVLAFFLWLSFASLQAGSPITTSNNADVENQKLNADAQTASSTSGLGSEAGTTAQMAKFVIAIGMLLGGMEIAQKVGGETGKVLGKGMDQLNKGKTMVTKAASSAATGAAKGTARLAGRASLGTISQLDKGIQKMRGKDERGKIGEFAKGWGADMDATAKKNRKAAASKVLGKMGIGEQGSAAGQTLIKDKTFQGVVNAGKGALIGAATAIAAPVSVPVGLVMMAGAAAVGGVASKVRGDKEQNIKNYEGNVSEYNKSKTEKDKADNEAVDAKTKYDATETEVNDRKKDNQTIIDDFAAREKQIQAIADKRRNGKVITKPELDEEKDNIAFTKNKDNQNKVVDSKNYLTDPSNTQAVDDNNKLIAARETLRRSGVNARAKERSMINKKSVVDNNKDQYEKDKKFVKNTEFLSRFKGTKAAMEDMTKDHTTAAKNVKNQASNPDYWKDPNASRCPSTGLRKVDKLELDTLNKGGGDADKALNNIVNSVDDMTGKVGEEWAMAIAAYEKDGGVINAATLGRVKAKLNGKADVKDPATGAVTLKSNGEKYNFKADSLTDKATTNYRQLEDNMTNEKGTGKLQYDAFAKNSAKDPSIRKDAKDIMGVSFDKINQAYEKNNPGKKLLEDGAGVNQQKVDGAKLKELSTVMSGLIDEEIKALQGAGAGINSEEISKLNVAKARLKKGDMTGMSLKNTDIKYKGDTDSERRQAEYNTTQHELIHQAGAKNEGVVDRSAGELQENKLVGTIPNSGGQRYDDALGKMIAQMEKAGATEEAMVKAVTDQISNWKVPNAQRVVETEQGNRDTVTEVVSESNVASASSNTDALSEKIDNSIDKLISNLEKTSSNGMSARDKNFFSSKFNGLARTVKKSDSAISSKLTPLSAIAMQQEQDKE